MKFPALCLAVLISASPLAAAEWPAAIEHYESLALEKPRSGAAMWQLWKYAVATNRVEELKARWEKGAAGADGRRYLLLLAFLDTFQNDVGAARTHYTQAAEVAPDDPAVWLLRGRFEAARGVPEARATLEQAAKREAARSGLWVWCSQRVTIQNVRGAVIPMPSVTHLEPSIGGMGPFDIAGLSVIELPVSTAGPKR